MFQNGTGKLILIFVFILFYQNAFAQSVGYFGFTPLVISGNSPSQVKFSVEVIGNATEVSLDFNPGWPGGYTPDQIGTVIKLRDDGTGGDDIAGDNIYSTLISKSKIRNARLSDDVNRVFVGFLNVYNGDNRIIRGNIFADVYSEDQGEWPITQVSSNVQTTSHLVNIHLPSFFEASSVLSDVTNEFYRWFRDDYDFLNIVSGQERFLSFSFVPVKNDVDGIGRNQMDASWAYGSGGRLQGILKFPIPGYFDGAANTYTKALAQQWINYLNFFPLNQGAPYWPYSSMGDDIMGVQFGQTFSCNVTEKDGQIWLNPKIDTPVFNDLDLYLMGVLPPEKVRTQYVFDDQIGAQKLECNGQVYNGSITPVSVEDVIDHVGPRSPPAGMAPTQFRIATILITKDGLASPEEMFFYSWFAKRAESKVPVSIHSGFWKDVENPFYVATGGRAKLDAHVSLVDEPLSIIGTPSGELNNRSLIVTIRPPLSEIGDTRQLFVAALYENNWFFLTYGGSWQLLTGDEFPVNDIVELRAEMNLQVLNGDLDLSEIVGTKIYVGYGVDQEEMLTNNRYSLVHVVQ